ncbi:MAG: hypothetical protein CVV44_03435 [Spirochaetae bacterium HGW-Spirochaetae-1]|nr:MAG: hypothetical protein CVV44_03435 [Spirochaetae bacterium HGW-Spirochaetae-1]
MMKTDTETILFTAPDPDALITATLVQSGFRFPEQANDPLRIKAGEAARLALGTVTPASLIKFYPVGDIIDGIITVDTISLRSRKLSHFAGQSDNLQTICIFLATLGHGFDEAMEKLPEDSMLESLFLHAAGSVLAEHYVHIIEEGVKRRFTGEGLETSLRFSPGYCDWDTGEGQKAVFSLINGGSIGIALNESGMMEPVKSVSGIILGAKHLSSRTPCSFCSRKECGYRRESRVGIEE